MVQPTMYSISMELTHAWEVDISSASQEIPHYDGAQMFVILVTEPDSRT
jgi:hypothetical protein